MADYLSMGNYASPTVPYLNPQYAALVNQGSPVLPIPDNSVLNTAAQANAASYIAANPTAGMGVDNGLFAGLGNWFKDSGFLQTKNPDGSISGGWGSLGLNALQGGLNAYMGMKQYGLAKDSLAFSKEQFNKNYAAQRAMTNSSLEDRQNARIAANPNAYESTASYMSKYGIK